MKANLWVDSQGMVYEPRQRYKNLGKTSNVAFSGMSWFRLGEIRKLML